MTSIVTAIGHVEDPAPVQVFVERAPSKNVDSLSAVTTSCVDDGVAQTQQELIGG